MIAPPAEAGRINEQPTQTEDETESKSCENAQLSAVGAPARSLVVAPPAAPVIEGLEGAPIPVLEKPVSQSAQVLAFQPRSSTGRPVLEIPRNWKRTQRDRPPCPVGYELNPKGERKIKGKTWVGYQYLRVDSCSECSKRARRPVVGFISPTAVWRLLQRDKETQKRLIQIKLIGGNRRKPMPVNLRCTGCATGTGSSTLRSIGE